MSRFTAALARLVNMLATNQKPTSSATVVITTKNRIDDLRKAVASALAQTANPEIIVMDDASSDGTAEVMRREFPQVPVHRTEVSWGYIAQRNRAARLASAPIIFSMDDDAVFSTPNVIKQTLREFNDPRIGAVAIPFVDVNTNPAIRQKAPEPIGTYAAYSFIGTAHALRRDLFLALLGYREILVHQGEEEDYCIRMLNEGYITKCGNSDPIHHFESPRRSWERMDFYGARNKILYAWHNIPASALATQVSGRTLKALTFSLEPRRMWTRFRGLCSGFTLVARGAAAREPVSRSVYRLSQELKRRGAIPLEEILSRLTESTEFRGRRVPVSAV
ncbi:MAG TPA: glycosyltransferase family 2 protein [Verrucomicrobiae bacterium]|nr:glycosyltransferase family 2 protein [Verrucomicrobiae bacterium]